MLYVFLVFPASQDFVKQRNTIICNSLWNGPDIIARSAAINDNYRIWRGKPYRLSDLSDLVFLVVNHLLRDYGGSNYDIKEYKINSTFYDELLHWWANFREHFSIKPSKSESVIWNNEIIQIDGKSIIILSQLCKSWNYLL